MDHLKEQLLGALNEKIALYRELAGLFEQEKNCIVKSEVAALWDLTARKQALAAELRGRREALLKTLETAGISHELDPGTFTLSELVALLPPDAGRALRPLCVQLLNLKDLIAALAAHNKRLLKDGLAMVEDLIGTIVNTDVGRGGYGRRPSAGGYGNRNLFLHQEA